MNRILTTLFVIATGLLCWAAPADAAESLERTAATRQVLVTFTEPANLAGSASPRGTGYRERGGYQISRWVRRLAAEVAADHDLEYAAAWPVTALGVTCVVFIVPADGNRDRIVSDLNADRRIQLAQPMQAFRTLGAQAYNDPYAALQRETLGFDLGSLHLQATGAGVTVAVIDTGIDLQHPDLAGQFAGDNNLAEPFSATFAEDPHGTAVAGIIAAKAGNAVGIVGIAPGARLLALKACWPTAAGQMAAVCNSFTLALAINRAIEAGARVLNMSLAGPEDPLLHALIDEAVRRGVVVVAAIDTDPGRPFPASVSGVIAVSDGAAASDDPRADALVAPGTRILTTFPNATYDFLSGSSFAAAHVSGLVALLLEQHHHVARPELMQMLRDPELTLLASAAR